MDNTDMTSEKNAPDKTWYSHIIGPFAETFGLSRPLAVATIFTGRRGAGFRDFLVLPFRAAESPDRSPPAPPAAPSRRTPSVTANFLATNYLSRLKILSSEGSEEIWSGWMIRSSRWTSVRAMAGLRTTTRRASWFRLQHCLRTALVFYRGTDMGMLSELSGKRLAIGPPGKRQHTGSRLNLCT